MMDPILDADELLVLARLDLQRGGAADALIKLKHAARLPKAPASVDLELARLYAQIGLKAKAEPVFRAYLERAPEDIDALFQLGMVHFEQGQRDQALVIWDRVLRASSGYPPALFYRAAVLADTGKSDAAMSELRTLMASIPHDNLYYEKSRELMARLATANPGGPGEGAPKAPVRSGPTSH